MLASIAETNTATPSWDSISSQIRSALSIGSALALTSAARTPVLPDVPTASEAGVPGYEATIWLGLMAPAGTPKPIIDRLNAAVNDVVKRPEIIKLWKDQGALPMSMTPEEFDKYLRGDIVKWAEVVKRFPDKPQ